MYPYEIERDAGEPEKSEFMKGGRKKKWYLPLDELEPGDAINLSMSSSEARDKVFAIRAHVQRESKKLGRRFSVYLSKQGIKVWRRYD